MIPRGGGGLKDALKEVATVPVMYAAAGNCHVYVHEDADLEMARRIAYNAKVQRPGVCNAAETLLVHSSVADELLPGLARELGDASVELVGDEGARAAAGDLPIGEATAVDWDTEYLDLKMAIGVVDSLEAAIDHINRHGTGHSEAIVTSSDEAADGVRRGRRRGVRIRQCLDTIHRWLRVRDGCRDRQLDAEAARSRADRVARADDVQVPLARRRTDPGVGVEQSRPSEFSAGPSTRRTSATWCSRTRRRHSWGWSASCWCRPARRRTGRSIPSPGAEVRLEMARLAARDDPLVEASDVEVRAGRARPTRSVPSRYCMKSSQGTS